MPEIAERAIDAEALARLVASGCDPRLARIFAARGVSSPEELATRFAALAPPQGLAHVEEAARLLAKAARTECGFAQSALGLLYASGRGVPTDLSKAAYWFGLAARNGVAAAQYNLAVMLHRGAGVARDDSAAHTWMSRAAAQGVTPPPQPEGSPEFPVVLQPLAF